MQSLWRRGRSLIDCCMALRLILRLAGEQWRHQAALSRREFLLMFQIFAFVDEIALAIVNVKIQNDNQEYKCK